jgi:Xaa-Pro dipeptidase
MRAPEIDAGPFRFSATEFTRRRRALESVLAAAGLKHALLYGANRSGSAVPWLTGWPVTREALVLVTVGEQDVLLVNFYNHVPNARRICPQTDVRWAGPEPIATIRQLLVRRSAGPVGIVGPLGFKEFRDLAHDRNLVDLGKDFLRLRLHKSAEEIAALRRGAALTDLAAIALTEPSSLGSTEHELSAKLEQAYVSRGGGHHIHYLAITSMASPDRCVPAQWPTDRILSQGDLLSFELSASSAPDYPGQLLRTFTVGAEPTPLVADLHAAAVAAFEAIESRLRPGVLAAELVDAARVVESAGFTTLDDLVHGFGGGYLPPVIGSPHRSQDLVPDFAIEDGMTVVVQPNVVTANARFGVQTGELLHVTAEGAKRLHTFPRGLGRLA